MRGSVFFIYIQVHKMTSFLYDNSPNYMRYLSPLFLPFLYIIFFSFPLLYFSSSECFKLNIHACMNVVQSTGNELILTFHVIRKKSSKLNQQIFKCGTNFFFLLEVGIFGSKLTRHVVVQLLLLHSFYKIFDLIK